MSRVDIDADTYASKRIGIFFPASSNNTSQDGDLTGQCVSLLKWFLAEMTLVLNPFNARGNAIDFGDNLVAQGYATIVAAADRKPGDIVVWKEDGGYNPTTKRMNGHIGDLLTGDRVFEQNAGIAGTATKVVDGVTVYASRIDPLYASWRKGAPTFYRINSYQGDDMATISDAEYEDLKNWKTTGIDAVTWKNALMGSDLWPLIGGDAGMIEPVAVDLINWKKSAQEMSQKITDLQAELDKKNEVPPVLTQPTEPTEPTTPTMPTTPSTPDKSAWWESIVAFIKKYFTKG